MDEMNLPGFSELSSTNKRYLANFGDEPSLSDRNKRELKTEDTPAVEETWSMGRRLATSNNTQLKPVC